MTEEFKATLDPSILQEGVTHKGEDVYKRQFLDGAVSGSVSLHFPRPR